MAQDDTGILANGVKLVGEAFITPGSSLILEGRVGAGLVHGALGLAAISLLGPVAGPVARLLIAANSYSRSVTDRNVWQLRGEESGTESGRKTPRTASSAA